MVKSKQPPPGGSSGPLFSKDPVVKVIYGAIKDDIRFNFDNGRYAAVITLTLSAIDAMAYVGMPAGQVEVTQADFVQWAERYVSLVDGRQLTGLDLYGARCAVLHQYGAQSRLSRQGKCRLIGWANKMTPPVKIGAAPAALVGPSQQMIILSVTALAESFFAGIDRFMVDAFAAPARRTLTEGRLRQLIQAFPYPKDKERA